MTVIVETRRWWRFVDGIWKIVFMSSVTRSNIGGGMVHEPATLGIDYPKETDIVTVEFEQ